MKNLSKNEIEIYRKLSIDFKQLGGIIMIHICDSNQFLEFCNKHNIGIYGIDIFAITENTTRPLLRWTRDYSELSTSANFAAKSTKMAIQLIQNIQTEEDNLDSLYIEFTL